jgi:hypothetical protein
MAMNAKAGILGCLILLAAAGAAAQQQSSVAQLTRVTGNVLVSRPAGLTTGTESQQIMKGSRIITTANSSVVVVFDNGCRVELKENQRLDVDDEKPCAALIPLGIAAAPAAGAPIAGYVVPALIGIGIVTGGGNGGPPTPVSPN